MHYSYILPIKSLHSCAKAQHARFSLCRIRAAVGHGERCRRCSVGHRERFRRRIQSWCWAVGCGLGTRPRDGRRLRADTRPRGYRRPRAGAADCRRAPGHGRGLPAEGGHSATGRASAARPYGCGQGPGHGRDCRLRAGPPAAARSAASRLSTARTSTMPKTRMNPFTLTFPRYCTVIGFICYVTNI